MWGAGRVCVGVGMGMCLRERETETRQREKERESSYLRHTLCILRLFPTIKSFYHQNLGTLWGTWMAQSV